MRNRLAVLTTVVAFAVSLAACSALSTGRDFPSPKPGAEIKNGATSKADLLKMFGDPTQVGMKDGDQTWTWYYFQKGSGKDGDLSKQKMFGNTGLLAYSIRQLRSPVRVRKETFS